MANLWCSSLQFLSHFTEFDDVPLSVSKTDMATLVKVMQLPDSGLEIRDRMWLKITIANAVIGLCLSLLRFEFVGWEVLSLCLVYCKHLVFGIISVISVIFLIAQSLFQGLMLSTGCSHGWRASRTAGMLENMPAVCWNMATWDTQSIKSPSRSSATTLLETCAKVQSTHTLELTKSFQS